MSEATFEGATVEAALEAAAAKIGAAVSELDYEVVEKKEDFWGMGDGKAVIKAWQRREAAEEAAEAEAAVEDSQPAPSPSPQATEEQPITPAAPVSEAEPAEEKAPVAAVASAPEKMRTPEKRPERAAAAPRAEGETLSAVDPGDISALLAQIFHDMEFDCTVTVEPEEEGFLATVDGGDKEALLEGNGRCLSALELLLNNAFRHKLPRGSKVRVDAGDFRNKRDEELSDLAFQVAHSAKESGRTQETQPLNPYERRLVHLALAEDSAVTTRSRGSGFLKNVQIIPNTGGSGRGRG